MEPISPNRQPDTLPAEDISMSPTTGQAVEDSVTSDFILHEYDALRAEIVSRLETQTQLTAVALALLGGLAAAVPFFIYSGHSINTIPTSLVILGLQIVALLFTSITWFFLENDVEMAYIGRYLSQQLSQQGKQLSRDPRGNFSPLHWDIYRRDRMNPRRGGIRSGFVGTVTLMLAVSRYGLIAVPSIITLVAASYFHFSNNALNFDTPINSLNTVFLAFNMLYLVTTVPTAFYAFNLYGAEPFEVGS